MNEQLLLVSLAVTLRILVSGAITALCARYILQVRPVPYVWAFGIAAAAHLLAKAADVAGLPLTFLLLLMGLVQLVLSYIAFKPTVLRLLAYWVAGFVIYMAVHVALSTLFDWNFLFGVWIPGDAAPAA